MQISDYILFMLLLEIIIHDYQGTKGSLITAGCGWFHDNIHLSSKLVTPLAFIVSYSISVTGIMNNNSNTACMCVVSCYEDPSSFRCQEMKMV